MLPAENGELYFIEKVAFQEPYRLVKLKNRTELSDYLMEKYDVAWEQDTTRPFIMENDNLLEGYRQTPRTTHRINTTKIRAVIKRCMIFIRIKKKGMGEQLC